MTAAVIPASDDEDAEGRRRDAPPDPGADVAADDRAGRPAGRRPASRRRRPTTKMTLATTLAASTARVFRALTMRSSRSSAQAEHRHHHHPGAGAEVAAVHAGQGREERRDRRHRGAVGVRVGAGAAPRSQRESRGWAPTSRQVNRISQGTTASKTPGGSASSSTAPTTAPTAQVASTTRGDARVLAQLVAVAERAAQRRRGSGPTVLDALATTGRQAHGDQHREAEQRGDADRRGQHPGPQPGGEDGELLEPASRGSQASSRRAATSLTISTWACMARGRTVGVTGPDGVGDGAVPGEGVAGAAGLGERLDAGLADQLADVVHQRLEQRRVRGAR